jgi:DNA-binding CsgD family transcriptional regulator
MFPHRNPNIVAVEPETYPLGEKRDASGTGFALAVVSLSHSPVEQKIYSAMLSSAETPDRSFTARSLMSLTGIRSLSTIRRGLDGLRVKLSIERAPKENGNGKRDHGNTYHVYSPDEILNRRKQMGVSADGRYGNPEEPRLANHSFEKAIARVADNSMLSRREAQVALCCVEGLTNAEIGKRLEVSEQTVKFHLRHVFIKFGVKRRAELISRLLM